MPNILHFSPMRTFLVATLLALPIVASAETLRIGGSGVALGGMALLGAAYEEQHPGTTVQVLPSLGSSGGVKALVASAIDISVTSRPLKDKERSKGAAEQLYATTPLALVTATSTKSNDITSEQLIGYYSGARIRWPDGETVRVVLRPKSETDTAILIGLSDAMRAAVDTAQSRAGLLTAVNDQDNAEVLETTPGSLGLVALGQIATENRNLKVLSYNGVFPDLEKSGADNVLLDKRLFVVTLHSPSGEAKKFLDFVFSESGQALLRAHGHMPAG